MRQRQRLVVGCIIALFLVACASTPPDRVAYTSIDQAVNAAQASLKAWNEGFYAPGVLKDPATWNARRDKAAAAYLHFQVAARLATTVASDLNQQANATKIASDAAADLIALIASLEK